MDKLQPIPARRALAYDLVLNGTEWGSGFESVFIARPPETDLHRAGHDRLRGPLACRLFPGRLGVLQRLPHGGIALGPGPHCDDPALPDPTACTKSFPFQNREGH